MNYNCVHDYYTDNFGDITVVVRIVKLWIIITTMTIISVKVTAETNYQQII